MLYNRSGGSACCCTTGVEVLALSSSPSRRPEKEIGRVRISCCRKEIGFDLLWAIVDCKPEKRQKSGFLLHCRRHCSLAGSRRRRLLPSSKPRVAVPCLDERGRTHSVWGRAEPNLKGRRKFFCEKKEQVSSCMTGGRKSLGSLRYQGN